MVEVVVKREEGIMKGPAEGYQRHSVRYLYRITTYKQPWYTRHTVPVDADNCDAAGALFPPARTGKVERKRRHVWAGCSKLGASRYYTHCNSAEALPPRRTSALCSRDQRWPAHPGLGDQPSPSLLLQERLSFNYLPYSESAAL